MTRQRVSITQTFPFSVSKLFDHLGEHENLAALFFPARVSRLRDGNSERNGVGSVRRLRIPPGPPFEETVTVFVPNQRIEYKITRGSPLKNHYGTMLFSGDDKSATLDYTIEFEGRLPGIGFIVKHLLTNSISRALRKLKL